MFLIIKLYLNSRNDCMKSRTREEMMKLWMYDTVEDVQEKNNVVRDV